MKHLNAAALCVATFCAGASISQAMARSIIIDGGNVDACSFDASNFGAVPANGSVEVPIGIYDSSCTATPVATFSLNIGGTSYSSMFVHENGIVSFGAPITDGPATPLSSFTVPVFAPFFADGAPANATSIRYGWTDPSVGFPNSFWVTWDEFVADGSTTGLANIFQLGVVDLGGGDFDLIFNYETIAWDDPVIGAQAGLSLGLAGAFTLAGAGVPGAYLGSDDTSSGVSVCTSPSPATALACNNYNDGSQAVGGIDANTGQPSNGYYLFKFRNGILTNPPNEVPLPAAAWLFVLGAGALGGRRLLRRRVH